VGTLFFFSILFKHFSRKEATSLISEEDLRGKREVTGKQTFYENAAEGRGF